MDFSVNRCTIDVPPQEIATKDCSCSAYGVEARKIEISAAQVCVTKIPSCLVYQQF